MVYRVRSIAHLKKETDEKELMTQYNRSLYKFQRLIAMIPDLTVNRQI